ncbi:hypothetical protein HY384_04195 [Candidatus Daviesbacteria bacterium]|nr:hypothetical protein [Candidatus Daviesbacteria bacterium]
MLQPFTANSWATNISNPFLRTSHQEDRSTFKKDKTDSLMGDFDGTELRKSIPQEPRFSFEDETKPVEFKNPIMSSKDQTKDLESERMLISQEESTPSSPYQTLKLKETLNKVIADFEKWVEFGTSDSLVFIASIKESLTSNYSFFASDPNSRVVANTLMLIFDHSIWSEIPLGRVKALHEELKRFNEGKFKLSDVKIFTKQAYRLGLTPIKRAK